MDRETTLTIPSELYERVERLAALREMPVAYVLEEALALAVGQMEITDDEAKMDLEDAAYHSMHPELFEKYAGQHVAIHNEQLVDTDPDEMALYFRIDEQFPDEVVLLKKVRELPEPDLRIWSPRFVRESAAIRKEEAAYRAMHSELFEKYAGQYVAVYKGELVDFDADESDLYRRIDKRYPYDVVLMKKVEKSSEKVYHFRSPRFIREG